MNTWLVSSKILFFSGIRPIACSFAFPQVIYIYFFLNKLIYVLFILIMDYYEKKTGIRCAFIKKNFFKEKI